MVLVRVVLVNFVNVVVMDFSLMVFVMLVKFNVSVRFCFKSCKVFIILVLFFV